MLNWTRAVRITLAALGVGLFGLLVWRVGLSNLVANMAQLGWGFVVILAVGGLSHVVKTCAWRFTFHREHRSTRFLRMLGVRLAGEAVSQLSFAGQLFGETTRALLMRSSVPMVSGVSSVVLDRGMYTFTGVLLIVLGAILSLTTLHLSETLRFYDIIGGILLLGFVGMVATIVRRRWPVFSGGLHVIGRISRLRSWAESKRAVVQQVEAIIYSFYRDRQSDFWRAFAFNLAGHACSVLEVYLVLWFLGGHPTLLKSFFIEVLTKLVNIAGAVIPGNYGAYEGGNMVIVHGLGWGAAMGLTLGITRRIRGLFWAGIGLLVLIHDGFRRPTMRVAEFSLSRPETDQFALE